MLVFPIFTGIWYHFYPRQTSKWIYWCRMLWFVSKNEREGKNPLVSMRKLILNFSINYLSFTIMTFTYGSVFDLSPLTDEKRIEHC